LAYNRKTWRQDFEKQSLPSQIFSIFGLFCFQGNWKKFVLYHAQKEQQRLGIRVSIIFLGLELDSTDVFSQTPQSLTAHKHVHSNYKHHSSVKFLVEMSPSGGIVYVSEV